jgi:site-specific DNA-methyltransferase (adenine-specific)
VEASGLIRREEIIGDCRLLLGDCLEILPALGKVDAVVTDPPYEFDAQGAGIFRTNRQCMDAILETGLADGFDHSILTASLCDSVVVFCHNDQLDALLPWLAEQFDRYVICMWHKVNPMPVANKHYKPDTELYIHAWKKQAHPIGTLDEKSRFFFAPVGKSEYGHPTVKPLPLMAKIIRNVQAEMILDPFMGSGTTGVACVRERRAFIGVERHEPYFDIACERIRKAYAQPDMFIERAPEPKQESLFNGEAA